MIMFADLREFEIHRQSIKACKKCKARKECRSPVPSVGDIHSKIMFVARNPGEQEDIHGEPLFPIDKSMIGTKKKNAGSIFNKILIFLGLTRDQVFITNAMKCFTTIPKNNRAPTEEELGICKSFLLEEILSVNPKLIVTLGREALASVTNQKLNSVFIKEVSGKQIVHEDRIIFPLMHPASILYNPLDEEKYKDDVRELRKCWVLLSSKPS